MADVDSRIRDLLNGFFCETRRRRVWRVAGAYDSTVLATVLAVC